MKKTKKDRYSNIAGFVIALSGAIIAAAHAGVEIPTQIEKGAIFTGIIATAMIGWLTGKGPDGKPKTL